MSRQLRRGGGIMNVKPRQKYGIGSIVRSITKPLSKIADKIIPNEIPELVNKVPAPIRAALLFTPAAPYVAAANAATALSRSQGRGLSLGDVANLGINYAAYGSSGGFGGQGRYQVPGYGTDGTFIGFGKPEVVPGLDAESIRQEGFNSTDLLEGADYSAPVPAPVSVTGSNATNNISKIITKKEQSFTDALKDIGKDFFGFEEFKAFNEATSGGAKLKAAVNIFKKNPTLFATSAAAIGYLATPQQPDESDFDYAKRKSVVSPYLERFYRQANPTKTDTQVTDFVTANTKEYAANGGLMGLRQQAMMGGGMMMPMQQSMPMGTPRINEGGVTELDYRAKGGFVPVGIKEKADDVPAMLSKNEFVMTADAVRAAGGGSIQKGAQKMYDTMKQLESRVV